MVRATSDVKCYGQFCLLYRWYTQYTLIGTQRVELRRHSHRKGSHQIVGSSQCILYSIYAHKPLTVTLTANQYKHLYTNIVIVRLCVRQTLCLLHFCFVRLTYFKLNYSFELYSSAHFGYRNDGE